MLNTFLLIPITSKTHFDLSVGVFVGATAGTVRIPPQLNVISTLPLVPTSAS